VLVIFYLQTVSNTILVFESSVIDKRWNLEQRAVRFTPTCLLVFAVLAGRGGKYNPRIHLLRKPVSVTVRLYFQGTKWTPSVLGLPGITEPNIPLQGVTTMARRDQRRQIMTRNLCDRCLLPLISLSLLLNFGNGAAQTPQGQTATGKPPYNIVFIIVDQRT